MIRFWPTAGIGLLLAGFLGLATYGFLAAVRGETIDVQGQWLGSLPLERGDDCRIRIFPTGAFDFECRGRTTYAAKGTWRQWDDNLGFRFSFFARDGKRIARLPEDWVFFIQGEGNILECGLSEGRGYLYRWKRASM